MFCRCRSSRNGLLVSHLLCQNSFFLDVVYRCTPIVPFLYTAFLSLKFFFYNFWFSFLVIWMKSTRIEDILWHSPRLSGCIFWRHLLESASNLSRKPARFEKNGTCHFYQQKTRSAFYTYSIVPWWPQLPAEYQRLHLGERVMAIYYSDRIQYWIRKQIFCTDPHMLMSTF